MGCFSGLSSKNPKSRLFLIRRGSERFLRKALKRNSAVYSVNAAFARGQKYKESKFRKLKIDDNELETRTYTESGKTDKLYETNTTKDEKIENEVEEESTKSAIASENNSQTCLESAKEEQSVEEDISQTTIECHSSESANEKLDLVKTDQYETQGKSSTQNINEQSIKIYPYPELEGLMAQYLRNNHEASSGETNNKKGSLARRKIQNPFLRQISIKTNSLSRETEEQESENRYGSFVSAKVKEFEAKLQQSDIPIRHKFKFISDETQVMPSPISKPPTTRNFQKRGGNNNNGTMENTQIENGMMTKWNNSEHLPLESDTIENSSFNLESLLTQVTPFRSRYIKQCTGGNDVTYNETDYVVDIDEEEATVTDESDKESDQTLEPEEHQTDFEEVATYNHNASRKSLFPNLSHLNGLPECGVDSSFESTAAEGERIMVEVQIETDTYQRWARDQMINQEESTEQDGTLESLDRRGSHEEMVGRISDLKLQEFDTLFEQTALRNLYKMREKAHRERMINETSRDDVNSRFILNCFGPSKRSKEM